MAANYGTKGELNTDVEYKENPKILLTFIGPCIANIFSEYNQQDATFHDLFISVRRCTCFRRFFPSIIRSSKLHIQRQTNTWRCMCSLKLLMMDRKTRLKHVERLTEIKKLWNVASCWFYSANILKYFSRKLPWRPNFTMSIMLGRHVPGSNIRNISVKTATSTVDETQSPKYSSIITVCLRVLKIHY